MDRWIFGFWMPIRKSTYLQGIALYIESSPITLSLRGEKSYSVFQMDRWIFWFLVLLEKSSNLQGIANG